MPAASRRLLGTALGALQRLRLFLAALLGRQKSGVLAVPMTREGKVVLVRLTYARGWRLPGGGIEAGEEPRGAALRELAEEIGMTGHGEIDCVDADGAATLFLVRDVNYRSRRSWEVEEVAEFAPSALPEDATPLTRRKIEQAVALLK